MRTPRASDRYQMHLQEEEEETSLIKDHLMAAFAASPPFVSPIPHRGFLNFL